MLREAGKTKEGGKHIRLATSLGVKYRSFSGRRNDIGSLRVCVWGGGVNFEIGILAYRGILVLYIYIRMHGDCIYCNVCNNIVRDN